VPRTVPAHQCLPSSVGHYLSTSHTRGRTSILADHLLPVEDLHCAGELHVPWPRNTIDLVLWGWCCPTRTVDCEAAREQSMTPRRRSGTLKLLKQALTLSLSHQGNSVGCSQMGRCCHHGCGWLPPHVVAQQTPPVAAPQTLAAMAQQAPACVAYYRVPSAQW
jgi:hypothetical protein